jgi:membrane associated rhomboid family serine protease
VIPLKDENPTSRRPFVTIAVVLACAYIWFAVQGGSAEGEFTYENAAIPCEVIQQEPLTVDEVRDPEGCNAGSDAPQIFPDKSIWQSVLFSMFLHGSLLHLGGNLLFLWIFGNNVEDRLGHAAYVAFYVVGGIVATLAHVAVNLDSTVPMVGASGAIAAVMGAYLVWYPNARIRTLIMMIFITFVEMKAKWLLAFWFVLQFFTGNDSGVAWMAHVGGFVFGVIVGLLIGPGKTRLSARRDRPVLGSPYWSS